MNKFVASFALLVCLAVSARAEKFLSVSDIHFDPFADPALVAKLEAADVSQWQAILATSTQTGFSAYGSDVNEALFRSALAAMKQQIPAPAFVLISGDFLAHDFQQTYQQYATDKSQAAYTAFVAKTITYVANAFRDSYPGVRIYPTLGNNDSDCGDYAVTPNSTFLANFRDTWSPIVDSSSFNRRFPTGGYYHADVRSLRNVRIIALDTNFFSTNYKNTCGQAGADPGAQELTWFEDELRLAREEGKQVWLLFHIPPGIDVFDTASYGGSCPNVSTKTFWKDEYQQAYLRIVSKYAKTILGTFAGHTHQDEYRIVAGDFVHITPSITPVFGNNPAFEIVDVRPRGEIADYTTYHLPNITLPWAQEYAFDAAYHQSSYGTAALTHVANEINSDTAVRTQYFDFLSSGAPKSTADALAKWQAYWCGLRTLNVSPFNRCYCPQ